MLLGVGEAGSWPGTRREGARSIVGVGPAGRTLRGEGAAGAASCSEALSLWAPAHCPVAGLAFWRVCADSGKPVSVDVALVRMNCTEVSSCRASGSCTFVLSLADLHGQH